jgi:hypothetical protein
MVGCDWLCLTLVRLTVLDKRPGFVGYDRFETNFERLPSLIK